MLHHPRRQVLLFSFDQLSTQKQNSSHKQIAEQMANIEKDLKSETTRYVVVTGFGLFRDHQLNTSWEAIRDGRLEIDREVELVTQQVAVSYDEVDRVVSDLWQKYNPILMIHIGLASFEKSIRVEQMARHGPYLHDDIINNAPHKDLRLYGSGESALEENLIEKKYSCKPCTFGTSRTCLNIDKICEKMMLAYENGVLNLPTKKSEDAGLYLCEYLYHKSLLHSDRTIFLHVPDMKNYKLEDISKCLKYLIELLIDDVINSHK